MSEKRLYLVLLIGGSLAALGAGAGIYHQYETIALARAATQQLRTDIETSRKLPTGTSQLDCHSDFAIARYEPDGAPDPGWGTDGVVVTPVIPVENVDLAMAPAHAIAPQPDGSVLAVGGGQAPAPLAEMNHAQGTEAPIDLYIHPVVAAMKIDKAIETIENILLMGVPPEKLAVVPPSSISTRRPMVPGSASSSATCPSTTAFRRTSAPPSS